jgi:hypothetical protein
MSLIPQPVSLSVNLAMPAVGRVGLPDEIGPMVASLLSENNRWINAQWIEAKGSERSNQTGR